jgi:hypothetical protein
MVALVEDSGFAKLISAGDLWLAEQSFTEPGAIGPRESGSRKAVGNALHVEPLIAAFGVPAIDLTLPHGGLPCGELHQFAGGDLRKERRSHEVAPPLTVLAHLVGRTFSSCRERGYRGKQIVLWIGEDLWPTPHLLQQITVKGAVQLLHHSYFIRPKDEQESDWITETALRSPAVAAIVAPVPAFCRQTATQKVSRSRRLFLAARQNLVTGFFVQKSEQQSGGALVTTSWRCEPAVAPHSEQLEITSRWRVTLQRYKGRQLPEQSWIVECCYGDESTLSLSVSSDLVDRGLPTLREAELRVCDSERKANSA